MAGRVEPLAAVPAAARERRLRFMTWFVRVAGIYNASAVVVLVTPGALDAEGGCPYDAARALADSHDEAALRDALDAFERLGARPAIQRALKF